MTEALRALGDTAPARMAWAFVACLTSVRAVRPKPKSASGLIFLKMDSTSFGSGVSKPRAGSPLAMASELYGATPQVVGLLVTTYAACQLFAGPVLGRLSDRFGRRPLLIVSQLGTFVGFLILGVARSLPLIFLSRFLDGITAGNLTLAQ